VEPQMDMQQLFAAAQQMQEQLMNAQQALADSEVTGTAGGGLVKAPSNGQGELLDLSIQPTAVEPTTRRRPRGPSPTSCLPRSATPTGRPRTCRQQQMGPFAAAMQGGGMPGMPVAAASTCPVASTCRASVSAVPPRRARRPAEPAPSGS